MLLMIDNYDSFTYNLVQYFGELGAEVKVVRNNALSAGDIERLAPAGIVVSPGPCTPNEAGISLEAIRRFAGRIPILGVCLGHQLLVQLHGGVVGAAPELVHGKADDVTRVADDPLLADVAERFQAGRYHSLAAHEPIPAELEVTARADDDAGALGGKKFRGLAADPRAGAGDDRDFVHKIDHVLYPFSLA